MSVTERKEPGIADDQDSGRRTPESHETRMVCCRLIPHLMSMKYEQFEKTKTYRNSGPWTSPSSVTRAYGCHNTQRCCLHNPLRGIILSRLNVLSPLFSWVSLAENPSKGSVKIPGICHGLMVRPILQKCITVLSANL